jgi:hypothetical protein
LPLFWAEVPTSFHPTTNLCLKEEFVTTLQLQCLSNINPIILPYLPNRVEPSTSLNRYLFILTVWIILTWQVILLCKGFIFNTLQNATRFTIFYFLRYAIDLHSHSVPLLHTLISNTQYFTSVCYFTFFDFGFLTLISLLWRF